MRFAAALPLLLLCACSYSVEDQTEPTSADIVRVEAKLAKHPCIGDLGQWERNYRFSRKTGLLSSYSLNPDIDVIEFHLRRSGTVAIEPGVNVMKPPPGGDWPDSSPIESIDGTFKLSDGKLGMPRCEARRPS
jgi:hypothetical protein